MSPESLARALRTTGSRGLAVAALAIATIAVLWAVSPLGRHTVAASAAAQPQAATSYRLPRHVGCGSPRQMPVCLHAADTGAAG